MKPVDANPYSPPSPPCDEQTVYYVMDMARTSLAEMWRVSYPNLTAITFVILAKLVGRPVRGNAGIAYASIRFTEISEMSRRVQTALEPICRECESLGFRKRFGHSLSVVGNGEAHAIDLSNADGATSSQAAYVRSGENEEAVAAFVSYLDDDTVLSTTNGRKRFKTPPEIAASYHPSATVGQILTLHESRVAKLTRARPRCLDDAGLREAVARNAQLAAKFHEARGVYVPLTNAEVERLKGRSE